MPTENGGHSLGYDTVGREKQWCQKWGFKREYNPKTNPLQISSKVMYLKNIPRQHVSIRTDQDMLL